MPITIDGSGTITGLSAGGLPDATIVTADIADANVTAAKLASGAARSNFGTGAVLQVVQATKTNSFTTTSTSFTTPTGLSLSITPSSSSNKILIFANIGFEISGDAGHGYGSIRRDSTDIFIGDTAGSRPRTTFAQNNSGGNGSVAFSIAYLDSPSTTSSISYSINVRSSNGTTVYVNRSVRDNDGTAFDGRTVSSIIAMEIAG
jgi:hypothetical protein